MNRRKVIIILLLMLVISIFLSVAIGRYAIPIKDIAGILASKIFDISEYWQSSEESLLLYHRLPRIIMAVLVGAALSAAGAAYQGVFFNPMASPDILGASSGAAFFAALSILLGLSTYQIMIAAFIGGLLSVGLVVFIATAVKGKKSIGLILAGIMISSLASSLTSFVKLVADPLDKLPAITYWLMGSLNGTRPGDVAFVLLPIATGLILLFLIRYKINLLSLGEDEARTMGVDVKRVRIIIILSATLLSAASVCVSGLIGWIGLVVPHFARRLVGNNYSFLMPTSMVIGAIFLLWVDNISRNLLATEIPIGILTSFIGAPFFLILICKRRTI